MMTEAQTTVQETAKSAQADTHAKAQEATKAVHQESPRVSKAAGKFMLASIGAVGLAQDWTKHAMDVMVARGEKSRKEARRRMHELRARGSNLSKSSKDILSETVGDVADLPSKADIDSLHAQIADLSAKIEALTKANAKP
jgi:polyhydroxyalkanoate synthesis regulator phasin